MITLYEAHQAQFDIIGKRGGGAIKEMAKYFKRSVDMDQALGFSRGTVRHWIEGSSNFAKSSAACAQAWVNAHARNVAPVQVIEPAHVVEKQGVMLLAVCDSATAERARKMLAIIGCEVTEV